MTILAAENDFREGLVAMVEQRHRDASTLFKSAMTSEKKASVNRPQMRYLSYFGLSEAMAKGPTPEAVRACEIAAQKDFFDPHLFLNLGKVYVLTGKTSKALATFEQGLRLDPENNGLRSAHAKIDRRKKKPIGWLHRDHPVNIWLGRMRTRLSVAPAPVLPNKEPKGTSEFSWRVVV